MKKFLLTVGFVAAVSLATEGNAARGRIENHLLASLGSDHAGRARQMLAPMSYLNVEQWQSLVAEVIEQTRNGSPSSSHPSTAGAEELEGVFSFLGGAISGINGVMRDLEKKDAQKNQAKQALTEAQNQLTALNREQGDLSRKVTSLGTEIDTAKNDLVLSTESLKAKTADASLESYDEKSSRLREVLASFTEKDAALEKLAKDISDLRSEETRLQNAFDGIDTTEDADALAFGRAILESLNKVGEMKTADEAEPMLNELNGHTGDTATKNSIVDLLVDLKAELGRAKDEHDAAKSHPADAVDTGAGAGSGAAASPTASHTVVAAAAAAPAPAPADGAEVVEGASKVADSHTDAAAGGDGVPAAAPAPASADGEVTEEVVSKADASHTAAPAPAPADVTVDAGTAGMNSPVASAAGGDGASTATAHTPAVPAAAESEEEEADDDAVHTAAVADIAEVQTAIRTALDGNTKVKRDLRGTLKTVLGTGTKSIDDVMNAIRGRTEGEQRALLDLLRSGAEVTEDAVRGIITPAEAVAAPVNGAGGGTGAGAGGAAEVTADPSVEVEADAKSAVSETGSLRGSLVEDEDETVTANRATVLEGFMSGALEAHGNLLPAGENVKDSVGKLSPEQLTALLPFAEIDQTTGLSDEQVTELRGILGVVEALEALDDGGDFVVPTTDLAFIESLDEGVLRALKEGLHDADITNDGLAALIETDDSRLATIKTAIESFRTGATYVSSNDGTSVEENHINALTYDEFVSDLAGLLKE